MRADKQLIAVIPASLFDIPDVAAVAAAATWDTPVAGWLVPDPLHRPGVLHAWYAILAEHAVRYGRVDLLADRSATAIWLDRTRPLPAPSHFLRRLTGSCGKHAIAVLRYEQLLEAHRPRTGHLQLAVLAAPGHERAAVLLAHRHQRLDRARIAAHGVAGSLDELRVMAAAGYLPGEPFPLPDGGPTLWPLWRQSRAARATARRTS